MGNPKVTSTKHHNLLRFEFTSTRLRDRTGNFGHSTLSLPTDFLPHPPPAPSDTIPPEQRCPFPVATSTAPVVVFLCIPESFALIGGLGRICMIYICEAVTVKELLMPNRLLYRC